jgi:hypothetical protein
MLPLHIEVSPSISIYVKKTCQQGSIQKIAAT